MISSGVVDDFEQVFSNLVESWDHRFPSSEATLAAHREACEFLADRYKL
jgi:hypothetical protein